MTGVVLLGRPLGLGGAGLHRSLRQAVVVLEKVGQLGEAARTGEFLQVGDDPDALQGALPEALRILRQACCHQVVARPAAAPRAGTWP